MSIVLSLARPGSSTGNPQPLPHPLPLNTPPPLPVPLPHRPSQGRGGTRYKSLTSTPLSCPSASPEITFFPVLAIVRSTLS